MTKNYDHFPNKKYENNIKKTLDLVNSYYIFQHQNLGNSRKILLTQVMAYVEKHNKKLSNLKILDIGCGKGNLLLCLNELGAEQLFGIDILPFPFHFFNDVSHIKKKFEEIKYMKLDIDKSRIPLESESIDIVFLTGVLEHLYNPANVFNEIDRICKRKGLLYMITPNSANLKNRISLLFGKSIYHDLRGWLHKHRFTIENTQELKFLGHIREYTKSEVIELLNIYNFDLYSMEYNITERAIQYPKYLVTIYNVFEKVYPPFSYSMNFIALKRDKETHTRQYID